MLRVRTVCSVQQQLTKVSAAPALALTAIHEPEIRQRGNPYPRQSAEVVPGQWLHQLPVPGHGP